jgi:hypothetical protein
MDDADLRAFVVSRASEGRTVKSLLLEGAERILKAGTERPVRRVRLPLVRSKRPGSLRLDNARIYDVISFP